MRHFLFLQKFQTRKSSAPIIKIHNTSPDASSSQESIPTLPPVGTICPYFENADHSYCPDCEDNMKYQQQPCCDGANCYRSSQYSEVNNLLNNLNRLTSCNCDASWYTRSYFTCLETSNKYILGPRLSWMLHHFKCLLGHAEKLNFTW